jgi:hypothetical protein
MESSRSEQSRREVGELRNGSSSWAAGFNAKNLKDSKSWLALKGLKKKQKQEKRHKGMSSKR